MFSERRRVHSILFIFYSLTSLSECTYNYSMYCMSVTFVPPTVTNQAHTHTHVCAYTFFHKNQPYNTSKQSHIHYIRFQNTWIHYWPCNKKKRLNKQNVGGGGSCRRPNRIDLNSNSPSRFLGAAEFACVGLHLFEGVRACSALFTVKRMKMKSQIVLHL